MLLIQCFKTGVFSYSTLPNNQTGRANFESKLSLGTYLICILFYGMYISIYKNQLSYFIQVHICQENFCDLFQQVCLFRSVEQLTSVRFSNLFARFMFHKHIPMALEKLTSSKENYFLLLLTYILLLVKSTQCKKLVPNALWFIYQNLKSCKSHQKK